MSEFDLFDDEDLDPAPPAVDIRAQRASLQGRCTAANLPIEDTESFDDTDTACRVSLPSGRERRWIYCFDSDDYRQLLDIPFENYTYLSGYDAVCLHATGYIEAAVRVLGAAATSRPLYSRLLGMSEDDFEAAAPPPRIELESSPTHPKTTISLGMPSREMAVLCRASARSRLSVGIHRDGIEHHDEAIELLKRITDTLFFQIDLLTDIPITLARSRLTAPRRRVRQRTDIRPLLAYPAHEYDSAPISLYWYARSALGMPLLQFLAFYQVIEFYFPTYSQTEARKKLRSILKDPSFRADRDGDLGRLLSAIQVTRSGGFGDERSQLRATLMECVDSDELRRFITSDKERADFLASKTKGLSDHKLPIAHLEADLRNDVADRIYDIRCKIVHTKSDTRSGEVELLLPFSKEAERLVFDIELAQYVAQRTLISASTAFKQ